MVKEPKLMERRLILESSGSFLLMRECLLRIVLQT